MWTIFKFLIFLLLVPFFAFAQSISLTNPVGKDFSKLERVSTNRSIMSCGERSGLSVYSSLDIKAILAISNMLSSDVIPLETDWETFSPLKSSSTIGNLNDQEIQKFPKDVQRILFYCLTWDESFRLKLFQIPQEALENIASTVKKKKPWSVLNKEASERIDKFSDTTIRDFVYLILRADVLLYKRRF